jgi:RND family efflux transporter MFP subunit
MMRFPFPLSAAATGAALALLGACGAPPPPAPAAPEVTVARPLRHDITEWDEFTGRLAAVESVEVRARVDGYVMSVAFAEGALVDKGDLLVTIDERPFTAVLARARAEEAAALARLELARSEESRAAELAARRLVSEQELDNRRQRRAEAEAQLAAAQAWVRAATLDVGYCEVRAPIAGRVGRRLVTAGNLVSGGEDDATLLTTIVSIDPIHVYVTGDEQVYLRYLRMAREGTRPSPREARVPARMRLADEAGWPHAGHVDFVDNQLDESTGTILGRALFPNPEGVLTPGLFARVQIRGAGPYPALLVPESALGADQARRIVHVLDANDTVVTRGVTPGRLVGPLRVITEGLTGEERVLVNGQARVRPGMTVKPTETTLALPADLAGVAQID